MDGVFEGGLIWVSLVFVCNVLEEVDLSDVVVGVISEEGLLFTMNSALLL